MSVFMRRTAVAMLALLGSAAIPQAAMAQPPKCEKCEAQAAPAAAPGMAMQRPIGPGPERPDCCPPVIQSQSLLGSSFAYHQLPGENMNMHYGLTYTPNPTFNAQMALWAPYAASAMAVPGWTVNAVVMGAEMRSDAGIVNAWPPTLADYTASGVQIVKPAAYISAWWTNGTTWNDSTRFQDQSAGWSAPAGYHMQPDGRRYMMTFAFYLFEMNKHEWRLRPIECRTPMLSWRINGINRMAAGTAPKLESAMAIGALKAPELKPGKDLIAQADRMGR